MPPQLQQTASNLRSIHLLRALLREASYLSDAHARQYFRRYIVNRFRAYQPTHNATASIHAQAVDKLRHRGFRRRHISIINERTRAMQRKAQKGLNYLRRANLAEAPCLEKILLFTYGRMGRRKYALLEHLLRPDAVAKDTTEEGAADEELAPLQKLYYSNERFLSFFDAPKQKSNTEYVIDISDRYSRLKAVVKSQCQNGVALGRGLKRPNLVTPIYNVWQRPMPVKRARNNVRRWYAETMTRLLPPLPDEEWDSIQAMISGKKWISFVKTRTRAVPLDPEPRQEEDQFKTLVHDALALDKPSKADRPAGVDRPHTLNPRFMQRLYAKIHTYCCKLEWNDERNKWVAVWGSPLHGLSPRLYSTPVDATLFAGVDEEGNVVKAPAEPLPKAQNEEKARQQYGRFPFYADFLSPDHPVRKEAEAFRHQRSQSAAARAGGD
ncbi:hypothetical protein BU26DRAFT_567923 [Trematosphaeria pertusa]|uniref:LYR motif-containing protein Cup1-like N-terminal domain-containing protein n=1 Tax=Trematosphaeria pertusa TaxID=390896 RepID=A0A6A6I4T7_9PLEO|nr:uncharacterized protein BU26DRAFT_567923 [Trematosphaeria pertusa]KAF2245326.1 hypothetical protein BU26DRAFT_567923 [Trematosphaeria pertusa]